jgi:hypothetical protein
MRIYDVYIIYRDGRNLFHKNFCQSSLDPSLISGFLSALSDFAKQALPSQGSLREIEKGDIKLILNHGKNIIMALVSETKDEKDLIYLNNRLKQLTRKIENEYDEILEDWDGNVDLFEGLNEMVSEIFRQIMRISTPPEIQELLEKRDYYFYSTDEEGLSIFEIFYSSSWSFKEFLKMINIENSVVHQILKNMKSAYLSLGEIKKEFNYSLSEIVRLLRHLALRGIISVCA